MALLAFPELAAMGMGGGEDDDATGQLVAADGTSKADASWSSLGTLMRKEQRIKVAKELNAAVLDSQGQGQETRLGGLIRLMSWGEEQLRGRGITVPGIDVSTIMQTKSSVQPERQDAESDRMIMT